jgi:hypothetical protein
MTSWQRLKYMTDKELAALFSEVTAFLNARPLMPASLDPKDGYLTPNSFLLLRANAEILPHLADAYNYGDSFECIQSMANEVWD